MSAKDNTIAAKIVQNDVEKYSADEPDLPIINAPTLPPFTLTPNVIKKGS